MSSTNESVAREHRSPFHGALLREGPSVEQTLGSTRLSRLGQEYFWIGIGQGLSMLGALVGVRLLTELLEPASYGELALGMTVAAFSQRVLFSPIIATCGRYFAASVEENQMRVYLRVVCKLAAHVTMGMLAVVTLVVLVGLGMGLSQWIPLLLVTTIFALVSGCSGIFDSVQNAARHRKLVAFHQATAQWTRFAMAAGLMLLFGANSVVAMLGYVLAAIVIFASQSFFFRSNVLTLCGSSAAPAPEVVDQWTRRMWSYMWPFAMWGVFTWAVAASDRWALLTFRSLSDVGRYAILYQLGVFPILALCTMMTQLMGPVLFSQVGNGNNPRRTQKVLSLHARLITIACLLVVVATTLAFVFHESIFWLLVASEYRDLSWLLPWIVLFGGLSGSGQVAALFVMSSVNSKSLIPVKIITAVFGIGFTMGGAYYFGIRGVIAGSIIYSFIHFIWVLCLVRAKSKSLQQSLSTE